MIAIVLVGILVDRPTLTFRTITIAAFGVLLLAPESVAHPSFQMSFAATLALIAAYQHGLPWRAKADTSLGARVALWGGREIFGLALASFVAGLATTPYASFHFHRAAPYGVIANLLAMPVVSVEVMPMGILGLLAMPFGFDAIFWKLMGAGIDWMMTWRYGWRAFPARSAMYARSVPVHCCLARRRFCCCACYARRCGGAGPCLPWWRACGR